MQKLSHRGVTNPLVTIYEWVLSDQLKTHCGCFFCERRISFMPEVVDLRSGDCRVYASLISHALTTATVLNCVLMNLQNFSPSEIVDFHASLL